MRILSAAEMREVDRLTTERFFIPSLTLMENAGAAVATSCARRFPSLASAQILVVCGKGNNGGDGLVAARQLLGRGAFPHVCVLAPYDQFRDDAKANLNSLLESGLRPRCITTASEWDEFAGSVPAPELLVDAILGTGLTHAAEGLIAHVIEDINHRFRGVEVLSVDLPSGLNCDSHQVSGPAIRADVTLTMTAPKICLAFPPASEQAGEVQIVSIGTPDSLVQELGQQKLSWITKDDCSFVVRRRPSNSNKGAYGHALIIAGSVGKTGAAILAGRAALRAGAGLVTVATSASAQPIVAQSTPELMTIPVAETRVGSIDFTAFDYGAMDQAVQGKSVIAIGPGLTLQPDTQEFARRVVSRYQIPTIVDADAVNAFIDRADELNGHDRVLILTPHPGEFARLLHTTPQVVQADRKNFAKEFATRHQLFLVLKGYRTLIATPDGEIYVNPTGNAGMAKGGTGDALTGILAGLLSQFSNAPPERVVAAGVFLHGRAGDYARSRYGEISMLAMDLIECLPPVFSDLASSCAPSSDPIAM
jgi:hydroxyethylthiazole kinase-like uncharacterized protein yjeF